jgi:hypothetical protein
VDKQYRGKKVKTKILTLIWIFVFIAGCPNPQDGQKAGPKKAGVEFLTVDFNQGQILVYKFVSSRDIEVLLEDPRNPANTKSNKYSDSMEIVMSYKPVKVSEYSLSTIEAKCEKVLLRRSGFNKGTDAAEGFQGRTFQFNVSPSGRIESRAELESLLLSLGEQAFRKNSKQGRVKEPDMICDILATQWFLWDSISSVPRPQDGLRAGDSWKSMLSIPTPMVLQAARDVVYTLKEVRPAEQGKLAVIDSSFKLSDSKPTWLVPYKGSFMQSGPFGFYTNYRITDLKGSGEELFNIDAGRSERYEQNYDVEMSASLMIPIVKPTIKIKQNITMELVTDSKPK